MKLSKFEKVLNPLIEEINTLTIEKEKIENEYRVLESKLREVGQILNTTLIENDKQKIEIDMLSEELDALEDLLEEYEEIAIETVEDLELTDEELIEQLEGRTLAAVSTQKQGTVNIKDVIGSVLARNLISMDKGEQPDLMPNDLRLLNDLRISWDEVE